MRPGRLDKLLYVGIAQLPQDKARVLQALTRKFSLSPDVDLLEIAGGCSPSLTGADLYGLCADAWMAALRRVTASHKVGVLSCMTKAWLYRSDTLEPGTCLIRNPIQFNLDSQVSNSKC